LYRTSAGFAGIEDLIELIAANLSETCGHDQHPDARFISTCRHSFQLLHPALYRAQLLPLYRLHRPVRSWMTFSICCDELNKQRSRRKAEI
jgi:hypothetical protein